MVQKTEDTLNINRTYTNRRGRENKYSSNLELLTGTKMDIDRGRNCYSYGEFGHYKPRKEDKV